MPRPATGRVGGIRINATGEEDPHDYFKPAVVDPTLFPRQIKS